MGKKYVEKKKKKNILVILSKPILKDSKIQKPTHDYVIVII